MHGVLSIYCTALAYIWPTRYETNNFPSCQLTHSGIYLLEDRFPGPSASLSGLRSPVDGGQSQYGNSPNYAHILATATINHRLKLTWDLPKLIG